MKNTIFKKVKSIHSKSNSKYYKNNGESNNHKIKLKKNSSNKDNIMHSETNNNNDINNININNNLESHTNFLTITIEKESINENNYNSEFKIKPINNNLNLSNKYQIKSKYIFIEKEKNLSPNLNHINNCINYAQKKIVSKKLKGNLISIKKNKNLCKNIKEKVNSNINSHNSNKVLNKIIIEPENQTIKNNDEININLNNESLNYEKKDPLPNTTSNTKNKYKHYNIKLKGREKSLNKKNKLIIEEEKTIVNDINYINKNIMNYFHKLSSTAENNNKKKDSKINFKEIINEKNEADKNNNNININPDNKNMKSNLSKNLLNSEKKLYKENLEIFQNNKLILMKQRELNKKITQKKLASNIKINITENKEKEKEKKINQNQNLINNKISNKKIIKKNIIKKRSNNNHEKEDLNQNISNSSINRNLFMKIDENLPNNIYKKMKKNKENINNSYFAIMKKKELKEMKSENISINNKLNNILLKANTSEEKLNIIPKNININLNLNKNNYNQTQINSNSKKNLAYFSQNSQNKIVNNSTNNIHKHNLVNKDLIKIKINNHNKENSINKYSNKNNNFKINLNDYKKHKMKRSISPNMNSNINLRHTANNKNFRIKKIESNFFMNEVIIDLSKYVSTNNNEIDDVIITSSNNSGLNNTEKNREHKYISPKNTIESKKLYSPLNSNLNLNDKEVKNFISNNFNSTYKSNKRNTINKNHINLNIENIFNTDNKINIISNNEKNKFDINVLGIHSLPNKKLNFLSDKKSNTSNNIQNLNIDKSLGDIQIPSIPEENIQVIPLKTMKYNNQHIITSTKDIILKFRKIFQTEKILNCILLFLSKEDFYYLSCIDNFTYKILIKLILNKLYNQIVKNINNNNIVKKIWNHELIKFSVFIGINNLDTIYQNYLSNSNNVYDKEISKDLLRTLPNDSTFQRGTSRYQKLFNILKAYSNYNNEIGYAQGMNFIVAKLIKFFDNEKEAFIYLDSLFNKLNMVEVIGIKNNLEKKMKIIHFLLKTLCPDILFFLEKKKINHEIFTAKWYITLFSKNFKYDNILMVIWNFSIIFGWKFIFLFSISVIISFKDKYINLDLYDFTQYMKNIFVFEHFQKKFNDVMKLTFNYMSQWKNITKKIDVKLYDKNNDIKNNKKNKIKRIKSLSEKDEDETSDNNDKDNYKEKEDIIFNDDYAYT